MTGITRRVSFAVAIPLAALVVAGALASHRFQAQRQALVAAWTDVHTPGAGLQLAVPPSVLDAVQQLRLLRATAFRMSPQLLHRLEAAHRLLEVAWPIQVVDSADLTVGLRPEMSADSGCQMIWSDSEFAIGHCRR